MKHVHKDFSERLPEAEEVKNAAAASSLKAEGSVLKLSVDGNEVELAPAIADTLLSILKLIAHGKGFRMVPLNADLTTQEAANLLNVSRPYLIKLLEEGALPYDLVGRHRRIRAEDLFAYKAKRDNARRQAMKELAQLDQELGLM